MYTQCSNCLTLFRINAEQLKAAGGKARCCQCDEVFNALDNLQEDVSYSAPAEIPPEHDQDPAPATEPEASPDAAEPATAESEPDTLNLDVQQSFEAEYDTDGESSLELSSQIDFLDEQNDGLETEPDYFAFGSESQMSELLDRDTTSSMLVEHDAHASQITTKETSMQMAEIIQLNGKNQTQTEEESRTEAEYQAELAEIDVADEADPYISEQLESSQIDSDSSLLFGFSEKQSLHNKRRTWPWFAGSVLLVILFFLQLIWFGRHTLIQYDAGRQLLGVICKVGGCQIPQRRDPSKIVIVGRNLSAHPEKTGALLLQINMVNNAPYQQPFPQLQLSLFNDDEQLIAQRVFSAQEYLSHQLKPPSLMPKAEVVEISMELLDPGKTVTGFKFDFL